MEASRPSQGLDEPSQTHTKATQHSPESNSYLYHHLDPFAAHPGLVCVRRAPHAPRAWPAQGRDVPQVGCDVPQVGRDAPGVAWPGQCDVPQVGT